MEIKTNAVPVSGYDHSVNAAFQSREAFDLMSASADFSLNTRTVNYDSCSGIENNHPTYLTVYITTPGCDPASKHKF